MVQGAHRENGRAGNHTIEGVTNDRTLVTGETPRVAQW